MAHTNINTKMKIKKGDKVQVIKGKDRGKSAKVMRVFTDEGKVLVEGLHLFKKSARPKKQGEKGQMISVAQPMMAENVQIVCPSCGKPTRIGITVQADKSKSRYCKKCKA